MAEAFSADPPMDAGDRPQPVAPPTRLLGLAATAAVLAWAVLPLADQKFHLVGWALGSLVTIGLVTAYSAIDAKRSQTSVYTSIPVADRARSLVAIAGVAAAAVHAFYFATKVAS